MLANRSRSTGTRRDETYWRETLAGFTAPTPLLDGSGEPAGGRGRFDFALDDAQLAALETVAERQGVTLSAVVQAAWALLLSRYSGEADVVFGVAVPGAEETPGLLPVRIRVDANGPVNECLHALQADAVVRSAFERTPLTLIRSWSDVPADTPLFESVVAFESEGAGYPLELIAGRNEDGMSLALAYDRGRFGASTVERTATHLTNLLAGIAATPDARVSELGMLSDAELHHLVAELNDTTIDYPSDRSVHRLFEAQAGENPDAIALVSGDGEVTYRDLNAAANRLAHHLRALGVGPERLVGVCLERRAEFVISLLAVLKAGGAYVPLDPDYPAERLDYMLEDSRAAVVVTDSRNRARLGELEAATVLLDEAREALAAQPDTDPEALTTPEGLAYVIYTSGSTGRPKGVAVRHAGLTNLVMWHDAAHGVTARDRGGLVAPLGFDASVWELWPYLACGASVALPPDEVRQSPPELCGWLEDREVTIAFLPTALVHEILGNGLVPAPSLRRVVTGGDLLRMRPGADASFELVNHYGPTEATVAVSAFAVEPGDDGPVPIGRPIANTRIYVLDRHGNPVPQGVAGELHIGGAGLARGYLNRPALTAERFVPDPFSGDSGARLYGSGDRARIAADGTIEFLGRVDHQVKIRGFRIEPGEIEAALATHQAIRDAVVIARNDTGGHARLVAYLVSQGEAPTTTELRAHLATTLPDYMVPAAFVALDELPITANGKLDRAALPAPEGRPELDAAYVAPRTPTEEALARIWSEVLKVERVGIHDGFFELGGHSLSATQVVARVRAGFGVDISPADLFADPTLAELAEGLDALGGREADFGGPTLTRTGATTAPLSFPQDQMWFYNKLAPGSLAYQTQSTIRVAGPLDMDVFERAVTEIARRHEILRTTYCEIDGEPQQVVHPPAPVKINRVDLSSLPADERPEARDAFVRDELRKPFDITQLPLLRWSVIRIAPDDHEIVLVEHHLVHDGWSYTVLMRELTALYTAGVNGEESPLEELPVQYGDYARWQRAAVDSPRMQAKRLEWSERLAGVTRTAELPTDYARPEVKGSAGNTIRIELPPELPDALAAFCREERVTPFMAMFAAFALCLHRHSGETDVTIASGFANRTLQETDRLIGMFVNPVPVRCDVGGNPTVRTFVQRVREVVLHAVRNQDFPFAEIVRMLNPPRDNSRSPLLEVMFSFHDADLPELDFAGAPGTVVERANGSAKADLNIIVIPGHESRVTDNSGIAMMWEYDTNLFDVATIERLTVRFKNLLGAMCAAPDAAVGDLDMLEGAERRHVVAELNDTAVDYPADGTVQELFEAQADATPDAVALAFGDEELTYAELNASANRLAHHLRDLGVTPETRVGICLERGIDLVTSLLAVLKAGGAYVPLDPDYPAERLSFMLEDSGVALIVTDSDDAERLGELSTPVLLLDEVADRLARCPDTDPEPTATADHLAYVIYTSGSTGTPKGVAVPHRGIVRLVSSPDYVDISREDVVLQLAPVSFDASTFEIWAPLLNGARVAIAEPGVTSPEEIGQELKRHGVTTAWLTASLFNLIVESDPGQLDGLRQLLAGGEALSPRHVALALEHLPDTRLINGYGPTESTTFTCCHPITELKDPLPIGRPIQNTEVYVLDAYGNPMPQGVAGELYIGGAGLARGYLNRPSLTADRFVPDPFSDVPGARLYATGDRVRIVSDGTIEFLGRVDHQVKIRGFRIEPGEIEAALRTHASIRDAVVIPRNDDGQGTRLVGYLVSEGDAPTTTELRSHLTTTLPDYMVPAALVTLDAFPINANGKLDRAALPAPDGRPELDSVYTAPRHPTEEILAGIWADLLALERVGVYDDFFELGGHSLVATQVVSRVRDVLGIELPLRTMFECTNVAALAQVVEHVVVEEIHAMSRAELEGRPAEAIVRILSRRRPEAPAIEPVSRDTELPLSFAQQRLWFIDQFEPGRSEYNVPAALRLRGRLDRAALERSLRAIVARHESLRTTFATVEGRPVQVVDEAAELHLEHVDLTHLETEKREAEARRLSADEFARPFDLSTGPVFRACLIELAPEDHVLVLTMHHIVADGWSMTVFTNELSKLYDAHLAGEEAGLEPLAIQYADFSVWQRRWIDGEVLDGQLAYWRDQLAGLPPVLELPTDRPRPSVRRGRGHRHVFELDSGTLAALEDLGREHNATLFMTLTAAFKLLLSRYSGCDDIVVGTPIAGRTRAELEHLIGFFANTLVLRSDLSGDPTFTELVARVRDVALGAYAHQDVPFEKLVEELQPARSLSHTPLFQVMFAVDRSGFGDGVELAGLELERLELSGSVAKFDLTVKVIDNDEGGPATGIVEYDTDLFDQSTIDRLVRHFANLLEAIAAMPDAPVSALDMLDEAERHHVVAELNDTAVDYPAESTVQELFEAQAEATPDAVAVAFGAQELTYAELNAAANRLAHHLRGLGVTPETRVGICLERGTEIVTSLLAVLKAGGAYVPLDPDYPAERLAFMLEDSGVALVVTDSGASSHLGELSTPIVLLDEVKDALASCADTNPEPTATADHLAYVIYTSGSTGTPKGVAVPHRGIVRLVSSPNYVDVSREDVVLQLAPASFDASTFEIWAPLLNGARVAIAQPGIASPEEIGRELKRYGVTTAWLTASLFNLVVESDPEQLEGLRQLLAGGEALSPRHVALALEHLPDTRLINGYGPTESTTFTCCHPITELTDPLPIGRPIQNTEVYVLDAYGNPTPQGVAGELYIGGAGLARGYLNRPSLTADRFVPDPFSNVPGARLYATGDRVRIAGDGTIEFLGRVDHQVKIRGFRIEPGEIEAVLQTHPAIKDVVVIPRDDEGHDTRLVAYLVSEGDAPTTTELRHYLSRSLPDYMIPAAFVDLDELPLSPNGKLDRAALPAPEGRPDLDAGYAAPRTPTEEILATIWAEVLGLERVGIHDDFFELGGHSLMATQVVSRVRAALDVELPLKALFESSTVAALAEATRDGAGVEAPPIEAASRDRELPLSFAQQRLWFIDQLEPGRSEYNVYSALRITGELDRGALQSALSAVVARHEALRTRFVTIEDRPVQVIDPAGEVPLERIDLSHVDDGLREAEVERVAAAQALRPFDLSTGPLLRAALIELAPGDNVLVVTMHHIVSDGWSLTVFTNELSALYGSYVSGTTPSLKPLAIQYADFALWQREWLDGEVLEAQLAYWREQLAGLPPVLELPTDRPRPAVRSGGGARHSFDIAPQTLEALRNLGHTTNATLFMTVLAAFKLLLSRYSTTTDIAVGTPIAGRTRAEAEDLIGFFVNTLVLRSDLSGDPTFTELVKRVRDVALGAYAHQDVPFEKLVEELQPARSLSHTPLFQVMFSLDNTPAGELALGDASISPFPLTRGTTKFDLTFTLVEEDSRGVIAYDTDLFDAATVERMATHLTNLLDAIATGGAEQRVSALDMLAEEERRNVVIELNDTATDYPEGLLHELIAAQAKSAPRALALVSGDDELTFDELNASANRLAHHLRELGVTPETLAGICLERGTDLVVSLLAVLKAGGAYVPLDPGYPAERLAFMLKDSGARVVVTDSKTRARLGETDATVVLLDETVLEDRPGTDPETTAGPDNLAYVIYTSGSTGTPKGVAVAHRSLANLGHTLWQRVYGRAARIELATVNASFSFDASVKQLTLLGHGVAVDVIQDEVKKDPAAFVERYRDRGHDVIDCTPTQLSAWLDAGLTNHDGAHLTSLVIGGEPIAQELWDRLTGDEWLPFNVYGPTEATVDSTVGTPDQTIPTIGRPLGNVRVYVLDSHGNPTPRGVPGELYIGGTGLARGYLNRPSLTAARFVPDLFSGVPGARLYRSGDRARIAADGTIEFLGRVDHQVKVRGFRIEPGEIEAALETHESVRDAVVVARDERLVAYVVAGGDAATTTELRAHLARSLPDYMVPAAFVTLDGLPLTPNGKLDRAALPAPEGRPDLGSVYVAPRNPTEEILAGIWADVLGVEEVGVHDDFFELGGHSLIATQVVSRVRDALDVELPLRALFESPRLEAFAVVVEEIIFEEIEGLSDDDVAKELREISPRGELEEMT